jgi:glycosyltransferase involved in cell wall biosynthesis
LIVPPQIHGSAVFSFRDKRGFYIAIKMRFCRCLRPAMRFQPHLEPMNPLVSICVPAFQAGNFLRATLESVAAQTYSSWELIVTEDGSADEAEEIVRSFAKRVAQRVVYSRHDKNKGLPATRNTGIGLADSEWVALLDADDLWKPSHLENLVRVASSTGAAIVCAASTQFASESGQITGELPQTEALVAAFPVSLYQGKLIILPSSAMVRRDVLIRSGLVNLRYRMCNDTELWFRLASSGNKFGFTHSSTCLYRKHRGGSLSNQHTANLLELGRLYDEYAGWTAIPAKIRRGKAASLYRYAGRTLMGKSPREARALFWQALKREWLNASTWYHYARSFFAPGLLKEADSSAQSGSRAPQNV